MFEAAVWWWLLLEDDTSLFTDLSLYKNMPSQISYPTMCYKINNVVILDPYSNHTLQ